jgi:hypothetical protein
LKTLFGDRQIVSIADYILNAADRRKEMVRKCISKNIVQPTWGGNLIKNPWFRDIGGNPSWDGWDEYDLWTLSRKSNQPSPNELCGVTAKAAYGSFGGKLKKGQVASFSTSVEAPEHNSSLRLGFWLVSIRPEFFQTVVYGRNAPNEQYFPVWEFFNLPGTLKFNYIYHDLKVSDEYKFYKIEFTTRFQEKGGVKITGVEFEVE